MSNLQTSHKHEYGKSRSTGVINLEFDENGISQDITEDQAVQLATISGSLSVIEVSNTNTTDNTTDNTTQTEDKVDVIEEVGTGVATTDDTVVESKDNEVGGDIDGGSTVEVNEEVEEMKALLADKSMKEIKELLTQAGKTEDELKPFTPKNGKQPLIDFAAPILVNA